MNETIITAGACTPMPSIATMNPERGGEAVGRRHRGDGDDEVRQVADRVGLEPLAAGLGSAGTDADALSIAAPCPRWRPPTLPDGDHRLLAFLLGAHRRHPLGAALLNDREAHDDQGRAEEDRRDRVHLDRDAALGGAEDVEGERDRRAGVEVRDHEVVDREREREQGARDDAGEDQGKVTRQKV